MTITVFGVPKPQGSKKFVGHAKSGRGILVESCAETKNWRQDVKAAAIAEMGGAGKGLTGPVSIRMVFTMPKPKSAPKRRKTWPDRKPDIDKLCRSTLDALVQAGAIEDDARVVHMHAYKVFPSEGYDSLSVPGAYIGIVEVSE